MTRITRGAFAVLVAAALSIASLMPAQTCELLKTGRYFRGPYRAGGQHVCKLAKAAPEAAMLFRTSMILGAPAA